MFETEFLFALATRPRFNQRPKSLCAVNRDHHCTLLPERLKPYNTVHWNDYIWNPWFPGLMSAAMEIPIENNIVPKFAYNLLRTTDVGNHPCKNPCYVSLNESSLFSFILKPIFVGFDTSKTLIEGSKNM